MILDFIITLLSSLVYLFVFWMRLREDYTQDQIFATGFYTLLGIGCGNILARNFFELWWFWIALLGGIIGVFIGIRRFRMRLFESIEAFILANLTLFFIVSLLNIIEDYNMTSLILTLATALFIAAFIFLDTHYKKFSWYKSGRVGFTGLTISGIFFLVRSLVAMSGIYVLSFAGDIEVVISGVISFLSFMTLYNLSGKT